ncbi:MAG: 6-bladed beta-propeller, partial [Bacteroidia bacterium]|nr:6-bladed beta-propeller [Bacteroidia bacterium]
MQTVKILVGFFLIIVLIGCRNTESHSDLIEINIEQNVKNVKPLNICDFNGELRYVSLKDNSILLKVAAESEFSGDKILVSDRTNCLLYDYQGNRLAIIGRKGKGPGEYNLIMKMKYCMASIYKLDGKTSFKEILNDTLFRVNDQFVFEPSYFLNLGKYKLPKEVRELPGAEMNKERKIYIFISKIFESSNYLFLDCNFQDYNPEKRTAPVIYKDVFGNSTEWWFYHAGML